MQWRFLSTHVKLNFTEIMIRRINLASLFCKSFFINETSRILTNSVSTSPVFHVKKESKYFLDNEKFIRKYEDTFGNIDSFERDFERIKDDPEDLLEYEQQKAAPMKNIREYITEIKSLLNANDYKSALKLLEVDMRNDRIRNPQFVYRSLISYNARLGDLKEAYRLFIDYKRRGGIVSPQMYTSMFDACANCQNSFLALEKAEALREAMSQDKHHTTNMTHYNVMLKAYGRHGDLPTCFKIMDEVLAKRDYINDETFSFLLQACISDKNSGLRHAFLVWREMLKNRTKPSVYTFNLMLKCIRDCSMGEVLLIPDAIKEILERSKVFYRRKMKIEKIGSEEKRTVLKIPTDGKKLITPVNEESNPQERDFIDLGCLEPKKFESPKQKAEPSVTLTVENQAENSLINVNESTESLNVVENEKPQLQSDFKLPNLLALEPTTGSVVEFSGMTTPQQRFLLVGGVDGFLRTMAEFGVKPNLKTFTQMFDLIPETTEMEEKFIALIESYKIELDTTFFNVLIKRRIFRDQNHDLIKDSLEKMHYRNLKPDIITFQNLAKCCTTRELFLELLDNIRQHNIRLSSEMITSFLKNAKRSRDMNYVLAILRTVKENGDEMTARNLALVSSIVKYEKRRKQLENESSLKEETNEIDNARCSPSQV